MYLIFLLSVPHHECCGLSVRIARNWAHHAGIPWEAAFLGECRHILTAHPLSYCLIQLVFGMEEALREAPTFIFNSSPDCWRMFMILPCKGTKSFTAGSAPWKLEWDRQVWNKARNSSHGYEFHNEGTITLTVDIHCDELYFSSQDSESGHLRQLEGIGSATGMRKCRLV